jgi:hypothetical protein
MDNAFKIPGLGLRFGLDPIIGLIPGLGDTTTSLVSLYILHLAARHHISRITLSRMALNIAIDYAMGSLPFVGDAFDLFWKSNQRNVALLRRHIEATPAAERRARTGDWLFVSVLILLLVALLIGSIVTAYYILAWLGHLVFARHG